MSETNAGTVRYERRGSRADITLDRATARNALTWSMYEQLDAALDRAKAEEGLRVVVLCGANGHFAAGTDISQFTSFSSADDGLQYERRLEAVVAKLESLPLATIAVVEGAAVGGGLALATACDLRICTPSARFGVPIARTVGNCLSVRNLARLSATLGTSRTTRLLFTAELMDAAEAKAAGYVIEVVEAPALDARVDVLATTLASHAPITLQVTKEAIRRIVDALAAADSDDLGRRAYGSRDFREGVSAFVERRTPEWEGR